MINFTGLTLKRVVNLGGYRSSSGNSVAYVEHARIKRVERENLRKRNRAARTIHSLVIRYLDLIDAGSHLYEYWSSDGLPQNAIELSLWLRRFRFLCVWTIPRFSLMAVVASSLSLLSSVLSSLEQPLSQLNVQVLSEAMDALFSRMRTCDENCDVLATVRAAYVPLKAIIDENPNFEERALLTLYIQDWLQRKEVCACKDLQLDYILLLLKGLSTSEPNLLHSYLAHGFFPRSVLVRDAFKKAVALARLENATSMERISILNKYLSTREPHDAVTSEDYVTILRIIHEPVSCAAKKDVVHPADFRKGCANNSYYIVDDGWINSFKALYTPVFTANLAELMMCSNIRDIDALFSYLFTFYPPSKLTLCMQLSLNPTLFRWLFTTVTSGDDRKHHALLPLIELYSYWLVISSDLELFSEDRLTKNEAIEFVDFLREICVKSAFKPESYKYIQSLAINLLNGLYQKDMRINFMPPNYWEEHQLTVHTQQLLLLAEQEELRRIECNRYGDSLSSEEEHLDELGGETEMNPIHWTFTKSSTPEAAGQMRVLRSMPYLIPFKDRVMVFRLLTELEIKTSDNDHSDQIADIRRESVLEDAFDLFHAAGRNLKQKFQVRFISKQGGPEVGIDGGGLTKEFLTSVAREGFNPKNEMRLFNETLQNQLYPNPEFYCKMSELQFTEDMLRVARYLTFMGNVVGRCLYENILIDVSFAPFFLEKWSHSSLKNSPNDLSSLDPQLYKNLWKLMDMLPAELDLLDLTFQINEIVDGKVYTFDIIPDGNLVKLTYENRFTYIHHVASFKLNTMLYHQSKYFMAGLYEIIHPRWLLMFDPKQLQMLLSGGDRDIDIEEWREHTNYGGYFDDDTTVVLFWQVVAEMTKDERRMLVKFVTSVSRAPLLGFGLLVPKFGIRNSGSDISRFPTASTCVNLLKLPDYKDKSLMKNKLLYAINSGAGFDLS